VKKKAARAGTYARAAFVVLRVDVSSVKDVRNAFICRQARLA